MDIALINKVLVKKKQGKNDILLKNRQMPKCLETKVYPLGCIPLVGILGVWMDIFD